MRLREGFQFLGELSSWTIKSFTNTVLGFSLLVSLTRKSDRFRFITETLCNTLLQQPCPNLLPAVQAPHAICMPLEQFTLSVALKGIYIFCLQWASPFFRLSEPLPPVVLPLSSLPVLSLEEMKRRRKERNGLPWGALVRQRSRLSELPVILYMQWMGLRSKGGDFVVYSSSSLFVCIFPRLSLLHFSSCTQKYEICSPAAEGEHGAFWQTEAPNNTSPGWHSQEWSLSSSAKWLCAFWEHRLDPSASQRLSRTMLKAPSSVCIYLRKDTLVPLGIG